MNLLKHSPRLDSEQSFSIKDGLLLSAVLLFCVLMKSWALDRPLLGNFSSYQLMLADIAKFYVENNFKTIFLPMTFISQTGDPGLLMLNFPLPSFFAAVFYQFFGHSVEFWGRAQTIFFAVVTTFFIYGFASRRWGRSVALLSAFIFNLSPLTTIYGQSLMYDMLAMCLSAAIFYGLSRKQCPYWHIVLWALVFGVVLALRIHLAVLMLPLMFLFYESEGKSFLKKGRVWTFFILSLILPTIWYGHTYFVNSVNPNVMISLFPQVEMYAKDNPYHFLVSFEFYKHILYYLLRYLLTPLGLLLAPIALIYYGRQSKYRIIYVWLLALLISFILLPKKYNDHNFYLWHWMLPLSVILGSFLNHLYIKSREIMRPALFRSIGLSLLMISIVVHVVFSYKVAFTTPQADQQLLKNARLIQTLSNKEDRIIIGTYLGRVEMLSLSERIGWPFRLAVDLRQQPHGWYDYKSFGLLNKDERLERAARYRDPIVWLELLKEQGARYFFVVDVETLNQEHQLQFKEYLESYPKVIDPETGIIRYQLS